MAGPLMLLGFRRDDDGMYTIVDPTGVDHMACDVLSVGRIVTKLVQDPEMPRANPEAIERNPVVDVAARVARRVAPEKSALMDMLEPLAHLVTNEVSKKVAARPRRNPAGRRRRAQNRM
jgi:hypothetical protein